MVIVAKDTFYFTHDYNARNDVKIKRLIKKHGMVGYGVFWSLVEELYNNNNTLPADYETIAFDLRIESETVKSIVEDFELFVFENGSFGSLSVQKRIEHMDSKSKTGRENARKRWDKMQLHSNGNANPMQSECKPNAKKDSIVKDTKEKKEEEIKRKKEYFIASLQPHIKEYGKETLNDFYRYWAEPNKARDKLKWEMQKTWELKSRLTTWKKNESKFGNGKKQQSTREDKRAEVAKFGEDALKRLLSEPGDEIVPTW